MPNSTIPKTSGGRPARVSGLGQVSCAVAELDAVSSFYRDVWGLVEVARDDNRVQFATATAINPDVVIGRADETRLESITFTARTSDELTRLVEQLEAAGCQAERSTSTPGAEVRTVDPDGNKVTLVVADGAVASPRPDAVPQRLGHVVLATPRRAEMEQFYSALGLYVTDRTHQGMSFLRCCTDHHTVALAQADKSWLQHVAFDVGTVDDVMRGVGRLRSHAHHPVWGPGRHGPGNNVFAYFQDPAGVVIEYYGEMESYPVNDTAATVHEWGPEHRGDVWGVAGPPPPSFFAPYEVSP